MLPSGYLIRPCDGGGSIIHIVNHLDLEAWSVPEALRLLYQSSEVRAQKLTIANQLIEHFLLKVLHHIKQVAQETSGEVVCSMGRQPAVLRTFNQRLSRGFNDVVNGFNDDGWPLINSDGAEDVITTIKFKNISTSVNPTNLTRFPGGVLCVKASLLLQVALDYIGKRGSTVGVTKEKRIKYAKEILQREMLPHVGVGKYCETKKAYYFGFCFVRLAEDLKMTGTITVIRDWILPDLYLVVSSECYLESFKGMCEEESKRNWGQANVAGTRAGVSQVLNRLTYASTMSHLRRLDSPIGRKRKLAKPRQLYNLQWGNMRPTETRRRQKDKYYSA
ncbi:hypothetical protein GIB67_015124 [Kingdonia uniflora]|uniref:DNA-directed RNA polymerase n=1 Tax=Kingdonia uniflora TaxID=39325 RepID=A0A7J7LJD1_9MAGN|nr:hypothetical protein GIB67_015124 [Kingdonia uniflora]